MISAPNYHHNKLKYIQLSKVDEYKLLAVIVVEGNIVKNTILDVNLDLSDEVLLSLNLLLNTSLNGLSLEEINLGLITKLKDEAGEYSFIVQQVLEAVSDAIKIDEAEPQIYTSGTNNIFKYPELSESKKASELIYTLEEKQQLVNLITDSLDQDGKQGIQVYIGNETPIQAMKNCSVVTATYELGENIHGTIGVIGPRRMDYEKVVTTLKNLMSQINEIYKK